MITFTEKVFYCPISNVLFIFEPMRITADGSIIGNIGTDSSLSKNYDPSKVKLEYIGEFE